MTSVLVAYDGSETARDALGYAARRVGPGGRLVVAHVVTTPTPYIDTPYYDQALRRARERGEEFMRDVTDLVGGVATELQVAEGPPARTLVQLARDTAAGEIVAGSRGHGAGAAALGSVSHALLHEADRPLVILTRKAGRRERRREETRAAAALPTEVVGYDGSAPARAALDYALDRPHGRITVVYAYDAPSSFLGAPYFGEALTDSQLRGRELLEQLQQDGLGADVELDLLEGPVVDALVRAAAARDADAIVVGSRGLGRFRGAFGSVSHALLHEADRPLVVVPGPAPE